MRCVRCNMELSEDSRFCEYCGSPQPERPKPVPPVQPQQARCCKCGRELPAGSRFCTFCGAPQPEGAQPGYGAGASQTGIQPGYGAGTPGQGGQMPYQTVQEPSKKADKNKIILIGCVIGLAVLLAAAVILTVVFITKRKNDGWGEEEKEERTRKEREIDREEEDEEELPEEEIEEQEIEEPAAEPEPEPEPEEAEEAPEQSVEGPYAEVYFDETWFAPADHPFDVFTEDEMDEFVEWASIGIEMTTDDSIKGTVHSASNYRDLETQVFYEPDGSGIRSIVTAEEQLYGSQIVMTAYIFENGELAIVREDTFHGSTTPEYENLYFFRKDCMIYEEFTFGAVSGALTHFRSEMSSETVDEQEDFLEDEAKYYNRGYMLLEVVSSW